MSLREALLRCFRDNPRRVFGIKDLCVAIEKYYELSDFQRELDPKHPQPRYHHEVRHEVAKLAEHGDIIRIGYNQYQLHSN